MDKQAPHSAPTVMPESDGAALGEFLRRARERRGLTLQQISKETRIPWRHLDALERGNLAAIPGQFYRRAEIRAYADVVHLDQNLALAQLERALGAPAAREAVPETPRTEAPPLPPLSRRHAKIAIGVVTVAVVFWLAAWGRMPAPDGGVQAPIVTHLQAPQGLARPAQTAPDALVGPSGQASIDHAATASAASDDEQNSDGELIVITEPSGGRVSVNGIGWGVTPVTIRHLPLGAKRIRVTKDGYAVEERVVRLAGDRPTIRLQIPLRSTP